MVTLELRPEVEERVKKEAEALGLPVEDYLQIVIESQLPNGGPKASSGASPAEKGKAWEEWAAGHRHDTSVILNDSREAIYGDDGR